MSEFLTTNGISYRIENIISNAQKTLVLITPYLQLSKNFFERLKDADNRKIKTIIIYGKSELNEKAIKDLKQLKNLSLYFLQNLHAKCFFNESELVITSMNLYEYSENNNREMGVYFKSDKDKEIYQSTINEVRSILNAAEAINPNKIKISKSNYEGYFPNKSFYDNDEDYFYDDGYCIRCKQSIDFDEDKPFCKKCFKSWVQYEDEEYPEKYCHECGKKSKVSMEDPICYKCD